MGPVGIARRSPQHEHPAPDGKHVITVSYPPFTSYRAAEVPVAEAALNRGMDAQDAPLHL